jgi:hypothetical protein
MVTPWLLARVLEPNRKLFPKNLSSILHGALVGADSIGLGLSRMSSTWTFPWYLRGKLISLFSRGTIQSKFKM